MTIYYDKLLADAALWTARSDATTSVLETCVRLAEAEIFRRIKVLEMETDDVWLATELDDFEITLPDDFVGLRRVRAELTNPKAAYVSPDVFVGFNYETQSTRDALLNGSSLVYTIESSKLKVNQPLGSGDPITLPVVYFRSFSYVGIDPSAETNAVLSRHYDLYLYAVLGKVWEFFDEDSEIAKYERKVDRAVEQIDMFEKTRRIASSGPLRRTSNTRTLA